MLKTMFVTLLTIGIGLTWVTPVNACQLCSNKKELKQVVCSMPVMVFEYAATVEVLELTYTGFSRSQGSPVFKTYHLPTLSYKEKCRLRFSQGRNFISACYLFNRNKPLKYFSPVGQVLYPQLC